MFEIFFKWLLCNYCNCLYYDSEYADNKKNDLIEDKEEPEQLVKFITMNKEKKINIIDNFL